jgi:phosphoenolpyruvate---glycerone phosphotransferase subunit DhaK
VKKLINRPEDAVRESLEGLALAYPETLEVRFDPTFVLRVDAPVKGKTALVSGGGSGHEPLHSGFVGAGMLDAACPGEVFTSPTPDQMLEAARAVNGGEGVLFIVKNYSGDVMNFEMAAELAAGEGMPVASAIVDDDVAVRDSLYTQGRRGVGTTVLAEKICGAAAEAGYDLGGLADLCRRVSLGGRSMGVALSSCVVPLRGRPTFELGPEEIELGIGIHGEPGRERRTLLGADGITDTLARSILDDPPYTRTFREWDRPGGGWKEVRRTSPPIETGDRVLAFVNGMGGTPVSELAIVYRRLHGICAKKGVEIVRNLVGSYVTSLEMQGCSITLLKMDDEMIELWDAPVSTPALRWGV